MIVARSLKEIKFDSNSVVTVGTFDGIHKGHRSIIKKLINRAQSINSRGVIITFEPHPRDVLGKGPVALLTTLDERVEIMNELCIDVVLVIEFTYDFSRLTSREFYQQYLVHGVGMREVIVGYDHMFGRDRKSNIQELRTMGSELGFGVSVVEPVNYHGAVISSTKIRNLLLHGDVETAAAYLDRPFALKGTVIIGDRRGETLGFPTANILPSSTKKLIPLDGVYFVSISFSGQQYYGMLNIGVRPTFKSDSERIIEVNIFEVNENLYSKELVVQFLKRIRPEIKFESKEELVKQLHTDRSTCLKYITEIQPS